MAENLEQGRFDLVIAVDTITDELKTVISYLNEHTRPEGAVLALELDYQADGDVEIVVPKFYGEESAGLKAQPSARRAWDEESFFTTLAQQCPEGVAVVRRFYEHTVDRGGDFSFGAGASPSVTVSLTVGTVRPSVWRCNIRPDARWVLLFDRMLWWGVAPERMQGFVDRLRGVPGLAEQLEGVEEGGWRKRASRSHFSLLPRLATRWLVPSKTFLTLAGDTQRASNRDSALAGRGCRQAAATRLKAMNQFDLLQ